MKTPPIVSPQEWQAARETLLVREKELTRALDAMAADAGGCHGWPWRRTTASRDPTDRRAWRTYSRAAGS
jgi:predicted dithiol-disulfide oxidoreductase (DUF899 family)